LLGGGLSTGTTTLIMGPAGVGKTSLAAQYVASAARRGTRSAVYIFDERLNTFMYRTTHLGLNLTESAANGTVLLHQVDPGQLAPGEFASHVRSSVDRDGVKLLFIDSLNGYLNAMQEESRVLVQLHELLSYLNERGVLTLMVIAQHGLLGITVGAPIDVSYLADTVILLRYFEADGAVHKAISVVKKRTGQHEETIREFRIRDNRIRVGAPLTAFRGVLTGVPEYVGDAPLPRSNGRKSKK
jgi:circadian clock protein KaiC